MPRSNVGVYSLPQSNFIPKTVILNTAINSNYSDIATAITQSLATTGVSSMSGSLHLSSGAVNLPALIWASETSTGFYLVTANTIGYATNGVLRLSLSNTALTLTTIDLTINNGSITVLQGNVTVFQNANITGDTLISTGDLIVSSGEIIDHNGENVYAQPFGMVIRWPSLTVPSLWLACDGATLSRTTYADLFAAIGTTFGAGDTSTTFNIPDYRGRTSAGDDDMGAGAANRLTNAQTGGCDGNIGDSGGEETHIVTEDELAAHDHTYIPGTYTSSRGTGTAQSDVSPAALNTNDAGSSNPHNNVQPTIVLNYIIYTGIII